MANLSNINGKFVVEQTTGFVGIGTTDPAFLIEAAGTNAELALNASSIYRVRSTAGDEFIITKNGVGDRLTISGGGDATFSGNITLNEDLNFSTNGFADISNTGTGAMRFKPSSQTLALTLTGANATFAGSVTANSLTIDDITIDGSTISDAGNFTIDIGGDISLDSNNGVLRLKDGGTEFGKISENSNNLRIYSSIQDGNILLQGNDGGSTITALTLDMSEGGDATFAGDIKQGNRIVLQDNGTIQWGSAADYGNLTWDTGYALIYGQSGKGIKLGTNGSTLALELDTSQNATFAGSATIETGINLESGVLVIKNATGDANGLRIFQDSSDASKIYNNYNGTLQLGVGNTTAITIDSSENATFAGQIGLGGTGIYTNSASLNIDGLGLAIKNDTAGSSNNWSLIKNTATLSESNIAFISGAGTAVTINHNTSVTFEGTLTIPTYIYHKSDPSDDTYFGFSGNDTFVVYTAGGKGIEIDSNRHVQLPAYGSGSVTGTATYTLAVDSSGNIIEDTIGDITGSGLDGRVTFWTGQKTLSSTGNFFWDNSNVRLGIGTSSPSSLLHLESASSPTLRLVDTTNTTILLAYAQNSDAHIGTYSNHSLVLDTNSTTALTIDSSQNATFAGEILVPSGDYISWGSSGATSIEGSTVSNKIQFRTDSSDRMIINNTGVGIGTTSPGCALQVTGAAHFGTDSAVVNPSSGQVVIETGAGNSTSLLMYTYNASIFEIQSDGATAQIGWGSSQARTVNFTNTGAGSIAVGIDTTSPDEKLDITGGYLKFNGGDYGLKGSASLSYNATSDHYFQSGGSTKVTFKADGTVGIGTTAPDHILCIEDSEPTLRIFDTDNTLNQEQTIAFGTEPGDRTQAEIASINTNTGNASGALSFKTNSGASLSERVRITQDGDVGIGTTSPNPFSWGNKHLTCLAAGTNQYFGLDIVGSGSGAGAIIFGGGSGSGTATNIARAQISALDGSHLAFYTNGSNSGSSFSERMRITSAGDVGIGTTSPGAKLDVGGDARVGNVPSNSSTTNYETKLIVKGKNNYSDGTNWYGDYGQIILDANSNMTSSARKFMITNALNNTKFAIIRSVDATTDPVTDSTASGVNSGTADFVIDNTGKIGIGTTTPDSELQIMNNDSSSYRFGYGGSSDVYLDADNVYIRTDNGGANTATFTTTGLGIGTTAPAALLEIAGSGDALRIESTNTGSGGAQVDLLHFTTSPADEDSFAIINAGGYYTGTTSVYGTQIKSIWTDVSERHSRFEFYTCDTSLSKALTIDHLNTITAVGDVVAYSDKKLKKNIKTLDGSKVYDMRGVSFTRKDNGNESSGVIAQEIQKIAPELISETDGTLGVAYGNLTGYLIEAVKELKAEIEELKKQIK